MRIGYKVFECEQDFIDWQSTADEMKIYGMSPVPFEIKGTATQADFSAGPRFGIFVTYEVPANT